MQSTAAEATEHFRITGDVGAAVFVAWIIRHARKLGLRGAVLAQDANQIEVIASGPPDLLDALSLGCSLGPQEVWVDKIERTPAQALPAHRLPANALTVNDFSSDLARSVII